MLVQVQGKDDDGALDDAKVAPQVFEALASGVPVAAFPVTGPIDVAADPKLGCLDWDLAKAARLSPADSTSASPVRRRDRPSCRMAPAVAPTPLPA